MYCYKCGKEIHDENKFCAYCGEKNPKATAVIKRSEHTGSAEAYGVNTNQPQSIPQNYYGENNGCYGENAGRPYGNAQVIITTGKERISNLPYVYLIVENILYLVLLSVITFVLNEYLSAVEITNWSEQMQYYSLQEVLFAVRSALLVVFGVAIIRNSKLFLITLGCQAVAGAIVGILTSIVQYIVSVTVVDIDMLFYGTYTTYENIAVIVLNIVFSCVAYSLVKQKLAEKNNGTAQVYQSENPYIYSESDKSPKSRASAGLLCFFFGILGVHRFYVGKVGTGLLWLFTGGLFGVGSFIDFFIIIFGGFKDADGKKV